MQFWIEIIKAFGYPTAVSIVLAAFIWRILKWFEPKADLLIKSWLNMMDRMGAAVEDIRTEMLTRGPKIEEIHSMTSEIHARGCGRPAAPVIVREKQGETSLAS